MNTDTDNSTLTNLDAGACGGENHSPATEVQWIDSLLPDSPLPGAHSPGRQSPDQQSTDHDASNSEVIFFALRFLPETLPPGGSRAPRETIDLYGCIEDPVPDASQTSAGAGAARAADPGSGKQIDAPQDDQAIQDKRLLPDEPGAGPISISACADPRYANFPNDDNNKDSKDKDDEDKDGAHTKRRRKSGNNPDRASAKSSSKTPRRASLSRRRSEPAANASPRDRLRYNAKRLGEIAEAKFLAAAAGLGFAVLKPWGDSEPYDFVLDARRNGRLGLSRVQVKSAHRKGKGDKGYSFSAHDFSLHAYTARDIDALIAYVVPENLFYVIPIAALKRARGIHLFPTSKRHRSKYEKFRNAWDLLAKPPKEE